MDTRKQQTKTHSKARKLRLHPIFKTVKYIEGYLGREINEQNIRLGNQPFIGPRKHWLDHENDPFYHRIPATMWGLAINIAKSLVEDLHRDADFIENGSADSDEEFLLEFLLCYSERCNLDLFPLSNGSRADIERAWDERDDLIANPLGELRAWREDYKYFKKHPDRLDDIDLREPDEINYFNY